MKRGDIWTAAGTGYASNPRPVVIIQDDVFGTDSVTVVLFTHADVDAPLLRIPVEPTAANGLDQRSWLMVDKITTVARAKLRTCCGELEPDHMVELERSIMVFLGVAR